MSLVAFFERMRASQSKIFPVTVVDNVVGRGASNHDLLAGKAAGETSRLGAKLPRKRRIPTQTPHVIH